MIWPASHEKGPLDISHSVDQDQPLYDFENTYIIHINKKQEGHDGPGSLT